MPGLVIRDSNMIQGSPVIVPYLGTALSREPEKPTVASWFNHKSSGFAESATVETILTRRANGQKGWDAISHGEGRGDGIGRNPKLGSWLFTGKIRATRKTAAINP